MAIVDLYTRCVDSFVDRVRAVGADQWTDPTPCADWSVRQLVNHIVYEQLWSVPLFDGATIAEVGDRFEGDLLGDNPVGRTEEAARAAKAAAAADGGLARTVHLSFGDTPAEEYLYQLFADHLVHGWDLSAATGGDRRLDPEAVSACAAWFAGREELYRGGGAIGPRVEAGPDASEQDRLIGAFGRDPNR